jgi:hypothetical protein
MLKVDEASKELESKSYGQIQKETAWKWASRAAASFVNCKKAKKEEKLVFWTVAEEFTMRPSSTPLWLNPTKV